MCGDSVDQVHVAALMGGLKANMVFTDPPYNIAYEGGGGGKREGIMNDKMSASAFREFLEKVCALLHEYCTGAEYICMSSKELDTLKQAFDQNRRPLPELRYMGKAELHPERQRLPA
jgi:DNA modification methylase